MIAPHAAFTVLPSRGLGGPLTCLVAIPIQAALPYDPAELLSRELAKRLSTFAFWCERPPIAGLARPGLMNGGGEHVPDARINVAQALERIGDAVLPSRMHRTHELISLQISIRNPFMSRT